MCLKMQQFNIHTRLNDKDKNLIMSFSKTDSQRLGSFSALGLQKSVWKAESYY